MIREKRLEKRREYRDCNLVVNVRRTVGIGIGTEIFEFEKVVEVKPKEVQNAVKLIDDTLNKLQTEREKRDKLSV